MSRGSSTSELQKKRKKNPLIGNQNNKVTAGEQHNTSVRNKKLNTGGKEEKKGGTSKFIRYKGKTYRRGTPMAKKAEKAEIARKKLGSKNYMSKEMVAKRNKRLKIKK